MEKMGKRNTDNKMMMFMRNIRLSKSCIGKEEIDAVTDVLHREYLGMGQDVHKFEDDLKLNELKELAREKGIKGYSSMDKEELKKRLEDE